MTDSNPFVCGDTVRIAFQSARPGKSGETHVRTVRKDRADRFRTDLGWLKRCGPDYWKDASGQLAVVTITRERRV